MALFCNESSILVQCAQNPWTLQGFRCIFQYFRCIMRKIPGNIPGMRPNRLAEEGDGTGWGLISATVTLFIPKQFPIGIGVGNFWGSVSVTVTLLIPKQFPIGIGIGNFWEINSKTISYRQVTFSVGTVVVDFADCVYLSVFLCFCVCVCVCVF